MKKYFLLTLVVLLAVAASFGQAQTNEALTKRIKALKADKNIVLTFDEASNMSKMMVVGDDFGGAQCKRAGVEALSFGMAFFYQGKTLTAAPETINFTFWVMNKKPKFAAAHGWTMTIGDETVDLGDARYAAKPSENMEYLNFKISRANLEKIAKAPGAKFRLGTAELLFTPEHLKTFADLLKILNS